MRTKLEEQRLQRFKQQAIERLSQGCVVNRRALFPEDVEGLVEELGPLVSALVGELHEAIEKMVQAEKLADIEYQRRHVAVNEERTEVLRLRAQIQKSLTTELRAELVEAELDEELRKAGFESPQGIAGLKDAMGFLKRHRADASAYRDYLSRIADIEGRENEDGPGEPIDHRDAMQRLDQIRTVIKEFDDYDR